MIKIKRGKTEQIWLCLNPDQMCMIGADILRSGFTLQFTMDS